MRRAANRNISSLFHSIQCITYFTICSSDTRVRARCLSSGVTPSSNIILLTRRNLFFVLYSLDLQIFIFQFCFFSTVHYFPPSTMPHNNKNNNKNLLSNLMCLYTSRFRYSKPCDDNNG